MLKHVSQSCSDVSARRSLRQNSFSLDSRLGASAEYLDELSGLEVGAGKNISSRTTSNSSSKNSSAGIIVDREYRSFCMTKTGNYSGLVTLPRNMKHSSVSVLNSGSNNSNSHTTTATANSKQLSESCLSLPNFSNITAIKVYAQCLRPHLSYKTVIITRHTTSRQVVLGLLSRFRMKHRDPKLFYLTMEVNIGEVGSATTMPRSRTIALEDSSCLADLISCNPWGTCRFRLQARQGGLIKVYDGDVRIDSVYKSIIVSHDSSVLDTVNILESCYNLPNNVKLRLYEVDVESGESRLLEDNEKPLDVKDDWGKHSRKIFRIEKTKEVVRGANSQSCNVPTVVLQPGSVTDDDMMLRGSKTPDELFTRSTLVRNTYLRQSVRKKQFLKSMINERNELETKSFSLSRFNLSDQIISESVEDDPNGGGENDSGMGHHRCVVVTTSTSATVGGGGGSTADDSGSSLDDDSSEVGVVLDETRSEGDLNCSTSGVSSLSCSSLDSLHGAVEQSFYT